MPLALSTGHEVGLAVTAAAFIAFALASSFLFPRIRPQFPGGGLPAFIVICFVFFGGMLAAVESFGAESGHAEGERAAHTETGATQPTTTQQQTTTTTPATTTAKTTTQAQPQAQTVQVTESEFKIALATTNLKAGKITFDIKNDGKIPHDLAIKGGPKTKLIQAGASGQLTTTLKAGKYHLYCSVPGHEQAGMKIDVTVSSTAPATTTAKTTTQAQAQTVQVTETEFKIALATTNLKAGKITFDVKNDGKIPHDLAIKGGATTKLIQAGASAQLSTTLKAGKYHLYCSVPGHEQAGMKIDVTVS